MELKRKVKILSWTLILLLIMNITAIGTIIYRHNLFVNRINNKEHFNPRRPNNEDKCRKDAYKIFLIEELNLSKEQQEQYDNIRVSFITKTSSFFDSIHYYSKSIDALLKFNEPDSAVIEQYSSKIGSLHKQLKVEYINYNFNIKSILDDNQKAIYFDTYKKFKSQHFYKKKKEKKKK